MPKITYTSHTFGEYLQISLQEHREAILRHLFQNPEAVVLDIGCGEGAALQQLKRAFPCAVLYGLDTGKPTKTSTDFTFIHGSIENLPADFFNKFDLIISVNVLVYVEDKLKALASIAKALKKKPHAKAYIGINPFYFGPFGERMFKDIKGFQWDKGYRNLIIESNDGKSLNDVMNNFSLYDIPQCLMANCWSVPTQPDIPKFDVPAFYTPQQERKMKVQGGLDHKIKQTRFWTFWEFIKVHTTNALGPQGPGEGKYRPMRFADSHVYLPRGLTERVIVDLLIAPAVYDACSVKKGNIATINRLS